MDELRNLPSGSQLLNRGLGQSPTCIRFLEATQLSKILRFLQHLSATFGLSRYSGIQEKYMGSALNNGAISSSGEIANGSNVSSVADGFLSWIFTRSSSEEQIGFEKTKPLREKKRENLSYKGALQTVEDLCLEEGWKREEASAEFTHESYESVLRRPSQELNESGNGFF